MQLSFAVKLQKYLVDFDNSTVHTKVGPLTLTGTKADSCV